MNSFSKQGKALPNKVRNEIIERYINNESYTSISRNLNLPYKTISNIVELWIETGSIEARTKKMHNRTARTDDSIAFIEYLKSEKPSMYGKKIQQELLRDNACLPHNVQSLSLISRILKSDLQSGAKILETLYLLPPSPLKQCCNNDSMPPSLLKWPTQHCLWGEGGNDQ